MSPSPEQAKAAAETHLQRTLTSVLNGLPADAALAAVFHQEQGPLTAQVHRGFTPRDVQAIVRTLSSQKVLTAVPADAEASRTVRLRLVTPGAKSLLGMPLRHRQRTYGFLVIGRKDNATFAKKDKAMLEQAGDDITKALERDSLFDLNMLLSRPLVSKEPLPSPATVEAFTAPTSHATPELQEKVVALLNELGQTLPFDRAWIGAYDPLAGNVEVLGIAGEHKTDPKDQRKTSRQASAWPWTRPPRGGPCGTANRASTTTWPRPKGGFSITSICTKTGSNPRWSCPFSARPGRRDHHVSLERGGSLHRE